MAKTAVAEKKVEPEVRVVPVTESRFGIEAEFNTVYRVNVEKDTSPEDTLKEDYWQHISSKLIQGDTIIVKPDHEKWMQELMVLEAGRNYAVVHQMHLHNLETPESRQKPPSDYKVEYAGPHYKWRVELSGRVLKDGFASEGLAINYAKTHKMAVDR